MDTKLLEKKMESISPFELKNRLIDMADESLKKTARTMLNAGRGNPNWIATAPREAFFLLGSFGLEECRRIMDLPEGIAGIPEKKGIASRFEAFLKKYNPQIQISAESETKRSIFREKDKTKRSKKESAQHSKSRNKSFVMTSVSAL